MSTCIHSDYGDECLYLYYCTFVATHLCFFAEKALEDVHDKGMEILLAKRNLCNLQGISTKEIDKDIKLLKKKQRSLAAAFGKNIGSIAQFACLSGV
jgi:hypothetical protein